MYVYILKCLDNSFYTGVTNNLERRLEQHQKGINPGCYTFSRRPVELVYHVIISDPVEAISLERKLKGWSRAKKIALIEGEFSLLPGLSECKNGTNSRHYKSFEIKNPKEAKDQHRKSNYKNGS